MIVEEWLRPLLELYPLQTWLFGIKNSIQKLNLRLRIEKFLGDTRISLQSNAWNAHHHNIINGIPQHQNKHKPHTIQYGQISNYATTRHTPKRKLAVLITCLRDTCSEACVLATKGAVDGDDHSDVFKQTTSICSPKNGHGRIATWQFSIINAETALERI